MKCTAQFIGSTPQVFLVPILFAILLVIWLFVFVIISLFIVSIGELGPRQGTFTFLSEVKMP